MGEIRPHLIRYWFHSSEKVDSPETFAEKVNEICTVYHETQTVREKGGHTISVDDFVEAIRTLVETDSKASWIFVCDGLNTHKSESLVRFVAEQCGLSEDLGCKRKSGILKSQESRAEFLHQKDHRIRIVYTPKHCSWMNQIEIWFGIINRRLLKRKSYQSIDELKNSFER